MSDEKPCLIVDCTDAHNWPDRQGRTDVMASTRPQQMPTDKRPTVLQPSRQVAEGEVQRLASAYPGHRFVIFEAAAVCTTVDVPTHTTISGQPWGARRVPVLLAIGEDDGIPF